MNLSIRMKLIIGCSLLVSIIAGLGSIAYYGKSAGKTATGNLGEMANDLAVGSEAAISMLMVRMNVKDFLINNEPREIEQYNAWSADLHEAIELSKESFQAPDRARLIREIEDDFKTYDATFVQVQDTITERNSLVAEMYEYGKDTRKNLTAAFERSASSGDPAAITAVGTANQQLLLARLYAYRFTKTSNPQDADYFEQWAGKLRETLRSLPEGSPLTEDFAAASTGIDEYLTTFSRVRELVGQRNELVLNTLDVIGPRIRDKGVEIEKSLIASVNDERQAANAIVANVQNATIIAIVRGMVVGVLTTVLLHRAVSGPIVGLTHRFRNITNGDGDLTFRLRTRGKDELADLGRSFNEFIEKIESVLIDTRGVCEDVKNGSQTVASASGEMAHTLADQQQRVSGVAAAITEMSASVTEVAQSSSTAADAGRKSDEAGTSGAEVVYSTVHEVELIAEAVKASAARVQDLGEKSEKIGEIIEVINDIADQTNLLALNAAIEAARAGEHGRGFAVVADEVRTLAERTTQATGQVSSSIQEIQDGTGGAVGPIHESLARAEKGVDLANEAGGALQTILESNRQLGSMIQGIAAATEEQAQTSTEMSRSVEEILASTREVTEGAQRSSTEADELNDRVHQLQQNIGKFKLSEPGTADETERTQVKGRWVDAPASV